MLDRDRLVRLLGTAACAPLIARLRQRLERGHPLSGTIVLAGLSATQREAVSALLGRPLAQTGEQFLSVSLGDLAAALAAAGVCDSLERAVVELTGPVENTPDERAAATQRWADVFAGAPALLRTEPFTPVVARWRETGSLKRITGGAPVAAAALLVEAASVAAALPAGGRTLAQLGAERLGHSHALDTGTSLATLVLQLAAAAAGLPPPSDTEEIRHTWAAVGVLCDELSAPALALNLPTSGTGYIAGLLRYGAAAGEPVHLSLRALLRHPLGRDAGLAGRAIHVCENATIVALAATRLGARCAPLISVQGQYATPTRVLLRQLVAAGARLRYHGDFDCGGLAIARRLFTEFPVEAWHFSAADYSAAPKSARFSGTPGPTPWAPDLAGVMESEGRLVHEEAVFEALLPDLDSPG